MVVGENERVFGSSFPGAFKKHEFLTKAHSNAENFMVRHA